MPVLPTVGGLDQWVDWQINAMPVWPVAGLTVLDGTATATNPATPHLFEAGDEVDVSGASDDAANGRVVVAVVDAHTLTWPVVAADGPLSGQVAVTYVGDAQGGRRDHWTTRERLAAEVVAIPAVSGAEGIQFATVQANVLYRVRIWKVAIEPMHRLIWEGMVLQIVGILRSGDSLFLLLNCTEGNPI